MCLGFSALATSAYFFLRRTDARLRKGRHKAVEPVSVAGVLKAPGLWRSLVVSGAVLVTVDLMHAFVPIRATEQNVSAAVVGLLPALRAAVSVASRVGLTRLIGRFGRKAMLIVSIGAAGSFAARLCVLGIFWANAALLLGAIAVVAGSDAGRPSYAE